MREKELFTLSDFYLAAREQKEKLEQQLKDTNAVVDEYECKLIEAMLNDELTGFKRNDVQFSLVSKSYISAEPEQRDKLWAEMKNKGYEHLFSINSQTLSAEVKRLTEDNNGILPTWLDGLVRQFDKPGIRVKK
jgi:hypothetical protein